MHIAMVTAGGAGMFCGSCMHDNAWARALIAAGHEVSLIPTYTPLTLDEVASPQSKVFLGGVNVYLDASSRIWRAIPRGLKRWLDSPRLLNLVTKLSSQKDYSELGDLTLSMLAGDQGPLKESIDELAGYLDHLKPDVVVLSNVLLSGIAPTIRRRVNRPLLAVLQGDDVFLDALKPDHKRRAIEAIRQNCQVFDKLLVHTRFYRDYMAGYLGVDASQFEVLPLSIDPSGHGGQPEIVKRPPTVGYFARLAPEKGLHRLIDAMELVRKEIPDVRLRIGGYQGKQYRNYVETQTRRMKDWGSSVDLIGSPETLAEKVAFFQSIDVLSVPTEFLEPKGLFVLEAMANGVPVVQPAHGSFPEMIDGTGGGWLVEPLNARALADRIVHVLQHPQERLNVAHAAHAGVRQVHSPAALVAATETVLKGVL